MTNQSKVILGFAAAALAGVGIGLLMAPESGTATRDNIRKGVNDLANTALDTLKNSQETIGEKVDGAVSTVKAKYNEAVGYVKSEVDNQSDTDFADVVEETVDSAKANYNQAKGYVKAEVNRAKNSIDAAV